VEFIEILAGLVFHLQSARSKSPEIRPLIAARKWPIRTFAINYEWQRGAGSSLAAELPRIDFQVIAVA
jgi:hypothetical protein